MTHDSLLTTPLRMPVLWTRLCADRFTLGDRLIFLCGGIVSKQAKGRGRDSLLGEAERFQHLLARARRTKGVDANRAAIRAGITLPTDGDAGLNRDACSSLRAKDALFISVALRLEDVPTWQGNDAGLHAVSCKRFT